MKTLLEKFVKKNRMYNPYSLSWGIVEKTFNNGCGSLALFRFYEDKKTVVVNKLLATKRDRKKLDDFLIENGMESWEKVDKEYGYPEYYFTSLSL